MSDPADELRAHVDAAHAAADKLVREAQRRAEESIREQDIPARGYETPRSEDEQSAFSSPELQAIVALLDTLRGSVPAELTQQLAEALRELLLAIRALIDWYLERLERKPSKPVEVQDIPIE